LYPGKLIAIDLKSRRGQCSRSQRLVREALLPAGAQWWVCRSAHAALRALAESGVRFHNDSGAGTSIRFQTRRLVRKSEGTGK